MPYPKANQRFIIPDMPQTDDLLPYLRQIDENRWYSNFGPLASRFENDFAKTMWEAHGKKSTPRLCLSMSTGTHALSVGLRLLNIGPGKRVLMPSVTFPACPLAVINRGGTPVFADVDPEKWVLTAEIALKACQNTKIDVVMPVSTYGFPLPADEWDDFIEKTGIPVIIDAAAAIENQKYPQKALVAHSMHALKPFGIGEGGILVLVDEEQNATARKTINFGMADRVSQMGGDNAKISEYHAAVALAQLDRWAGIKSRRKKVTENYIDALTPLLNEITPHKELKENIVSCFMISLKSKNAAGLSEKLLQSGLPVHRTYLPPLYTHPHFADIGLMSTDGKITRDVNKMSGAHSMSESVLGLPFHAFMSEEEIINCIKIIAQHID